MKAGGYVFDDAAQTTTDNPNADNTIGMEGFRAQPRVAILKRAPSRKAVVR